MQTTMTRARVFSRVLSSAAQRCFVLAGALLWFNHHWPILRCPTMTFKLWIRHFICLMGECGGDSSTDFYQRTEMEAMQRGAARALNPVN